MRSFLLLWTGRGRWRLLVAFVVATALLITAAPASAAGTLTVTNVAAGCQGGYSFTVSGSGFAADASVVLWVFDNVFPDPPPAGQFEFVRADATGSFTLAFPALGSAQVLPAIVEVTDFPDLNVLAGPVTVSPVTCGSAFRPDLSVTDTTNATTVTSGDSIAYTVTVANHGTADAHDVQLTDVADGPGTISCTTTPPTCSLGTITAGASVTVQVVVTTNGPGRMVNSATATTTDIEPVYTDNTGTAPEVTVNAPPPPPPSGCTAVGEVNGDGHFKLTMSQGKKADVHVQVEGDCDVSKQAASPYLHHAQVTIQVDGGPPLLDATTDGGHNDVVRVAIVGSDVTISGTYKGSPFVAALHEGGPGSQLDAIQITYGTFTTATLIPGRTSVSIARS